MATLDQTHKTCRMCGLEKATGDFQMNRRWLQPYCNPCAARRHSLLYQLHGKYVRLGQRPPTTKDERRQIMRDTLGLGTVIDRRTLGKNRRYAVNETYFDVIDTPEKAYWLGFIFADGSVEKVNDIPYSLRVEIDKKDTEHLRLLRTALSSDAPLVYRRNAVGIVISHRHLAEKLVHLRPKDTATPWENIDPSLRVHFIRGVFDGDGCITGVKPGSIASPRLEWLGNEALCRFVATHAPVDGHIYKYQPKRVPNHWLRRLIFNGTPRLREMGIWLYGSGGPLLERKLSSFLLVDGLQPIAGGSLPQKIQVNAITGASAPSTIDGDLNTGLKQPLLDIFTIPNNTNITQEACEITASGMKRVRFYNAAGDPANSGDLQRNATDILFHDGTAARRLFHTNNAIVTAIVGPHALGGATDSVTQLNLTGSFAGTSGIRMSTTITPGLNASAYSLNLNATIVEHSSGTHLEMVGLYAFMNITAGAAATTDAAAIMIPAFTAASGTTNASGLKINGAPTGATNNYALWVAAGDVRLVSNLGSNATPAIGPSLYFGDATSLVYRSGSSNHAWWNNNASSEHMRLTDSGILLVGTTVTTGAAAGNIVLAKNTAFKSVNNAGNGTFALVEGVIGASDAVVLASGGNDIVWGRALVALGGGSAPTLGTIGGSGPATAAQNTWMRVIDSTGAAFWVPAWK